MSLHLNDVPCYLNDSLILVKDDAPRPETMQSCLALWSVSISGNASTSRRGLEWKVCPTWSARALPSSGLSESGKSIPMTQAGT